MRSILLTLWLAVLGLVLVCPSVPAADPIDSKPPQPAVGGGLNVSLVTSGYCFNEFSEEAPKTVRGRTIKPEAKDSFVASVSLSNRSRAPISFLFNDAGSRWMFRVLNSQDEEVWRSDADILSAQVITEGILGVGKTWKRSVRIPLVIDDVPLVAGVYTVQAFLNARVSVSATSTFEVVAAPGKDTGIKGLVLKEVDILSEGASTGLIGEVPVANAGVMITSNDGPFAYPRTLTTDSEGRFTVNVPPGRYKVTTFGGGSIIFSTSVDAGVPLAASAEVVVQDGAFSEVTLHLKRRPDEPITQGISGTVQLGGLNTLSVPPLYLLQHKVRVTQIDPPAGTTPFEWAGRTDIRGKFTVTTPPGKFEVFATTAFPDNGDTPMPVEPPTDSETVTVEPHAVTSVNLVLESPVGITLNK